MKTIFTFIWCLSFSVIIICQRIPNPVFGFGGTKLDWYQTLSDNEAFLYQTDIDLRSIGQIFNAPVEINKQIIFKINNYNSYAVGDVLASYDLETGINLWTTYLTPAKNDSIGFNYHAKMGLTDQGEILLQGSRSIIHLPYGNFTYPIRLGFFSSRIINPENGLTKQEKFISNSPFNLFFGNATIQTSDGSEMMYRLHSNLYNRPYNAQIYPTFIDFKKDTIWNLNSYDTLNSILLYTRNADGISNVPLISGPFSIKENEHTFLAEYEQNGKSKHFLWKTDRDGNILLKKEVTADLAGLQSSDIYYSARQIENYIILTMASRDGTQQRHRGYIFIDLDGNVIRKNTEMVIEGKKVGHIVTTPLKDSNELMHAIRFQESNDLYLYRETINKEYIKAAQLSNPNSAAYAFVPLYQIQTSDDGIVVSGHITLDTFAQGFGTCRFDCVGWPLIMKLGAATLGLSTTTKEMAGSKRVFMSLTPNPSDDICRITLAYDIHGGKISIADQTGREIITVTDANGDTDIDISALGAGMYYVSVSDSSGKRIGQVQKLIKMN